MSTTSNEINQVYIEELERKMDSLICVKRLIRDYENKIDNKLVNVNAKTNIDNKIDEIKNRISRSEDLIKASKQSMQKNYKNTI